MDNQGNIKAMARGSTPIYVQGWKDSKCHCISDKVIRNHGKLITKSATSAISDEDRVVKVSFVYFYLENKISECLIYAIMLMSFTY